MQNQYNYQGSNTVGVYLRFIIGHYCVSCVVKAASEEMLSWSVPLPVTILQST